MQARTLTETRSTGLYAIVGFLSIGIYVAILTFAMGRTSFGTWWGIALAPVLLLVSVPVLRRRAARETDPRTFAILVTALIVKLLGAFIRYNVGLRDANVYSKYGADIAINFRRGVFSTGLPDLTGTHFIRFFTGVVYTLTGTSKLAGCVVFSWMGFWGLYFFYRAFRISFPELRWRPYAYLLFFLPSLVFWPSSIGKDAWMTMTMGLATFGLARLLKGWTVGAFATAAAGLWLAFLVRPHVPALLAGAFLVALVTRKGRAESRELAPVIKVVSIGLAAIFAITIAVKTSRSLGISTSGGLGATLTRVESRTSKGHSDFTPTLADSPIRFPIAAMTVLFRPFLFEAHNRDAAIAALESTILLGLCLVRWRWILSAFRSMRTEPYLVLAFSFVILFIVAFSSFANFGLLARERTQLYPLFLVLISIPPIDRNRAGFERRLDASVDASISA